MCDISKNDLTKIQEGLTSLTIEVAKLTTSIALNDQQRASKDDEYERRLQNHGDRIRSLEVKEASRDDHGDQIEKLGASVDALEAAVNRTAWLPVVATGVLVSIIAGITATIISSGG